MKKIKEEDLETLFECQTVLGAIDKDSNIEKIGVAACFAPWFNAWTPYIHANSSHVFHMVYAPTEEVEIAQWFISNYIEPNLPEKVLKEALTFEPLTKELHDIYCSSPKWYKSPDMERYYKKGQPYLTPIARVLYDVDKISATDLFITACLYRLVWESHVFIRLMKQWHDSYPFMSLDHCFLLASYSRSVNGHGFFSGQRDGLQESQLKYLDAWSLKGRWGSDSTLPYISYRRDFTKRNITKQFSPNNTYNSNSNYLPIYMFELNNKEIIQNIQVESIPSMKHILKMYGVKGKFILNQEEKEKLNRDYGIHNVFNPLRELKLEECIHVS
jgi:hypothetical protein